MKQNKTKLSALSIAAAVVAGTLLIPSADAAGLANKSVRLSNQNLSGAAINPGTNVTYTFAFTPTGDGIKEIWLDYGASEDGTGAWDGTVTGAGATVSGLTGTWTAGTHDNTAKIVKISNSAAGSNAAATTVTVTGITNASTANPVNDPYNVRIRTFSDAGVTEIDSDAVVFVNQTSNVQVTATLNQTLKLTLSGSSVNLGTLNPNDGVVAGSQAGTITVTIDTNAANGYDLYITGNTLTAGSNTIPFVSDGAVTADNSEYGVSVSVSGGAIADISQDSGFATQLKLSHENDAASSSVTSVTYKADAAATQQPGSYVSNTYYVATGKF